MAANTPRPQAGSRNQKFQSTFVLELTNAKTDYSVVKIYTASLAKEEGQF
jgi:hypothetical protein